MKNHVVYGIGGYDPTKPNNNIVEDYEILDPPRLPLDVAGAIATLLVVLGLANIDDAANAAQLTPDDLIREAQAWAIASEKQ